MVIERPPFGGDQNAKNVDYFLKNGKRKFKYILLNVDF